MIVWLLHSITMQCQGKVYIKETNYELSREK